MKEFFVREGVRAVAVHSGTSSAPRTTSLGQLQSGELDVIFAVDMFNEGVDVPAIDTVLMLRPTESSIIWMQQLGRGLRRSPDKDRLKVIDYIGNHRAFLMKLRSLAALLGREDQTNGRLRELLEEIKSESISLPQGCAVTYDLVAISLLEQLLRPAATESALEAFYRDFRERHGVRPTAVEIFHAGLNPRSNGERSWLGFVERMRGLDEDELRAWSANREFLTSIEKTEATRSYKIVLLLALLEGDDLTTQCTLDELTRRVSTITSRIHKLREDFSVDTQDMTALRDLLVRNPIDAFLNARGTGGVAYFKLTRDEFGFAFDIEDAGTLGRILRELIDWRLAQYLSRGSGAEIDVVCRVSRNSSGSPILFLPSSPAGQALERGELDLLIDGKAMVATVAKIAINIVRSVDAEVNILPETLRRWFGDDVGLPGRSDRVRLHRINGDSWVMEAMGATGQFTEGLKRWERYSREAIPAAFGLTFDQATWNAGFVSKPPHLFLLVTLQKEGMMTEHQYTDHFLSDVEFSWQSQNRTAQVSKHGQMIKDHREMGLHVHLLVRKTKKTGSKPTPFTYCGEVEFQSWEGEKPITVVWRLQEPVPQSLRAQLSTETTGGNTTY